MQMSFQSAFKNLKDNEVNKINLLYYTLYVPIYYMYALIDNYGHFTGMVFLGATKPRPI